MTGTLARRDLRAHQHAFTLIEMLVSMAVLTLFLLVLAQLLNSAATITTQGNKLMNGDSQGRSALDRMAADFSQMVKRSDVDYYLKGGTGGSQTGNDQMAFYSAVPGYYPSGSTGTQQSPMSLVAYRVNSNSDSSSYNKMERLGKGLVWNGVSTTDAPVVFLPLLISTTWPYATNQNPDPSLPSAYEVVGPDVFRFEYYYLLIGQTVGGTTYPSKLSYTPWDTRIPGHNAVAGFRDVSAIGVTIAVLDPKSRVLVSDTQLGTLRDQMHDFSGTMQPGDLDTQWQSAVNGTTAVPRPAASAIRIYSRMFSITP
jgi:prepilin-type N-terminal cleavage/methylation domain-containing protein